MTRRHRDWLDEDGNFNPPVIPLQQRTVIFDRRRNGQVMWIDGVVTLPVGAEIELVEPNVSAVVTGVRLLSGTKSHPCTVCIDVDVPAEWWDADE